MKVTIQPMVGHDTSACFDLENKCFGYKTRFDKEMLHSRLTSLAEYGISFTAWYKKEIIGHIISFVTKTGDIYLDYLCVESKYQRKGVGKQLLEKLERENPRANIWLRTGSNNQRAVMFYLKMGYEIHKVKGDDWKYKDIVMVLKRK
jgi:ribosomal protein S18 acetylase RimI-like enzyme